MISDGVCYTSCAFQETETAKMQKFYSLSLWHCKRDSSVNGPCFDVRSHNLISHQLILCTCSQSVAKPGPSKILSKPYSLLAMYNYTSTSVISLSLSLSLSLSSKLFHNSKIVLSSLGVHCLFYMDFIDPQSNLCFMS